MALTYERATELMKTARNPTDGKPLENNTRLYQSPGGSFCVVLHSTQIIIINKDGTYNLNSGGWETVTTKDRINHYGPARLYSDHGQWRLEGGYQFRNDMLVNSQGIPLDPEIIAEKTDHHKRLAAARRGAETRRKRYLTPITTLEQLAHDGILIMWTGDETLNNQPCPKHLKEPVFKGDICSKEKPSPWDKWYDRVFVPFQNSPEYLAREKLINEYDQNRGAYYQLLTWTRGHFEIGNSQHETTEIRVTGIIQRPDNPDVHIYKLVAIDVDSGKPETVYICGRDEIGQVWAYQVPVLPYAYTSLDTIQRAILGMRTEDVLVAQT